VSVATFQVSGESLEEFWVTYSLNVEEATSRGVPNNAWVAWDACRWRREDVTVGNGQCLGRGLTSLESTDYDDLDPLDEDGLGTNLRV
jgi:hypothetical protein